jgi:hypothetical protein
MIAEIGAALKVSAENFADNFGAEEIGMGDEASLNSFLEETAKRAAEPFVCGDVEASLFA